MTLQAAARIVRAAGGEVSIPNKTGELLFVWRDYRVRVNGRRKDMPRILRPMFRAIHNATGR